MLGLISSLASFCFYTQGASFDAFLEKVSNAIPQSATLNRRIQFELLTEVLLSEYSQARLDRLAKGAHQYEAVAPILNNYASDPAKPVRREFRKGIIFMGDKQIRLESALIRADSVPLFARPATNHVTVLSKGLLTDYRGFHSSASELIGAEASIQAASMDSVDLPMGLNRARFLNLVHSLTNIQFSERLAVNGRGCIPVSATQVDSGDDYLITFDEIDFLPVAVKISHDRMVTAEFLMGYSQHAKTGRKLSSEETVGYENGREVYRERWDILSDERPAKIDQGQFKLDIPSDTLVNEYRYGAPFTYRRGYRPPTPEEMEKMSKDPKAVLAYELASKRHVVGMNSVWIFGAFLLLSLVLYSISRRRRTWPELSN